MIRPNRVLLAVLLVPVLLGSAAAQEPKKPEAPAPAPAAPAPAAPVSDRQFVRDQLGIDFAVTTSKLRRAMVRTATPWGFAVRSVAKDSPAAAAGLARGTIVMQVDGVPLREVGDLAAALRKAQPGQKLVLQCSRRKAKVKLLDRHPWEDVQIELVVPAAPAAAAPSEPGQPDKGRR